MDYNPAVGSKRYFVVQAMKRGGTHEQIRSRAARLAKQAGKPLEVKDLETVDVGFLAKFLHKKGFAVTYHRNTVRVSD